MEPAASTAPEPPHRWDRAVRWWVTAGTFAAGLLVGGVLVGFAAGDTVVRPSGSGDQDVAAATVTSAPVGAAGEPLLGEDCLRALNAAQDLVGLVDGLAVAVDGVDAALLDEFVRELQPLQDRLRGGVEACDVRAAVATGSSGGPSSVPAPTGAPPTN